MPRIGTSNKALDGTSPGVHTLKGLCTDAEWKALVKSDPSLNMMAGATWQDFASMSTVVGANPAFSTTATGAEKPPPMKNRRKVQKYCFDKSREFAPIGGSIRRRAGMVAGVGFEAYSPFYKDLNAFIRELWFSPRNRLYARAKGWFHRMKAEGELFILFAFDERGAATLRVLEPANIGGSDTDSGVLRDPEDVLTPFWYKHTPPGGNEELIPSTDILMDALSAFPTDMLARAKKHEAFKPELAKNSKGNGKFAKLGGYRRFVFHWKNLSGIAEYDRDVSDLASVMEAATMYMDAQKWGMDYKKALSSFAVVFEYTPDAWGKAASILRSRMTDEQKANDPLLKPFTPGSKIVPPMGMSVKIINPQLQQMNGENRDLLNLIGAGLGEPQDTLQGHSSGTYASVKATRSPWQMDILEEQGQFADLFRMEILRVCLAVASAMGYMNIQPTYAMPVANIVEVKQAANNQPPDSSATDNAAPRFLVEWVDAEPWELIETRSPEVNLVDDVAGRANAMFGSKNGGAISMGVARQTALKAVGIHDFSRQMAAAAIEDTVYGPIQRVAGTAAELAAEAQFQRNGSEGGGQQAGSNGATDGAANDKKQPKRKGQT